MEMAASTSGSSWAVVATASSSPALNTWSHIAVVRNGTASNNLVLYLNGVSVATGSVSSTALFDNSGAWAIGADSAAGTGAFAGYISNFRYVKGSAVYTAAFTPPNGPLQAISGTSLLTCAYSTFRDGSTNNFTITVNGNTAVSTQNPFPLTTLPNPALGNAGNGVYSMSQYQSLLSQNLWPAVDPYWRYVTLMLHGNGTNGAQNNTFLDSSTNNFTITRNGNTTQGTFSPFGSNWSNYFDGSGDYLALPDNAALEPGSSNLTWEMWVNTTNSTQYATLYSRTTASFSTGMWSLMMNLASSTTGDVAFYVGDFNLSSPLLQTTGVSVRDGAWHHIAVVRNGSAWTIYVDGISRATATWAGTISDISGGPYVGSDQFYGRDYTGYLTNLRVLKGTALYTATFTPPTSPLTAITNTSLLTCQSNRFIDNSTNAFTITVNGTPSIQRFSPFAPTAPYAAGTDGGSGYFDGSGDYLRVASNTDAALSLGTSDFTYEAWVYPTAFVSGSSVIGVQTQTNGTASNGFALYLTNTGAPGVLAAASSGAYAVNFTGTAIPLNAWTHLAVTRSGNTFTLWRNGVSDGTATSSVTITQDSTSAYGGWNTGGSPQTGQGHNGYIVDRLTKSGALYSTTFTPPSAPFTTTVSAGTVSLLCSMTNAGIIDNAEMNNLETVGNAQISTAQSKFGGASMLFDGTGDYLVRPDAEFLRLSSGDFTIEAWVYLTGNQPQFDGGVASYGATTTSAGWTVAISGSSAGGTLNRLLYGVNASASGGAPLYGVNGIALNTWTHIAVTKSGTTVRLFINGSLDNSGTVTATPTTSTSYFFYVGTQAYDPTATTRQFAGYIDDLRITKGYARYTANFSVPTAPFPLS
jgi:hypothetical protein